MDEDISTEQKAHMNPNSDLDLEWMKTSARNRKHI